MWPTFMHWLLFFPSRSVTFRWSSSVRANISMARITCSTLLSVLSVTHEKQLLLIKRNWSLLNQCYFRILRLCCRLTKHTHLLFRRSLSTSCFSWKRQVPGEWPQKVLRQLVRVQLPDVAVPLAPQPLPALQHSAPFSKKVQHFKNIDSKSFSRTAVYI